MGRAGERRVRQGLLFAVERKREGEGLRKALPLPSIQGTPHSNWLETGKWERESREHGQNGQGRYGGGDAEGAAWTVGSQWMDGRARGRPGVAEVAAGCSWR